MRVNPLPLTIPTGSAPEQPLNGRVETSLVTDNSDMARHCQLRFSSHVVLATERKAL